MRMKKIVIVIAICLLAGTILSSCNRELCPAYSKADTEQVEEIV